MAIPARGIMNATATRNPYAAFAAHDIVSLAFTEQDADSPNLTNHGLSNARNSALPAFANPIAVNGSFTNSTPGDTWHPYSAFDSDGRIPLYSTGAAETVTIPRGTILLCTRRSAPNAVLFSTGLVPSNSGAARIRLNSGALIAGVFPIGASEKTFTVASGDVGDPEQPIAMALSFGELGLSFRARCGDTLYEFSDPATGGIQVNPSKVMSLLSEPAWTTNQNASLLSFVFNELQLPTWAIYQYLADPTIRHRRAFDRDTEIATHCAITARPTTDSVSIAITTGLSGPLAFTGSMRARILWGTSPVALSNTLQLPDITNDTLVRGRWWEKLSGLTPGQRYYYIVQVSVDDGATYEALPCGLQTFRCDPGRTGTVTVVPLGDCHTGQPAMPQPEINGFGADEIYRGASASHRHLAAYDARLELAEIQPDLIIGGHDYMQCDSYDSNLNYDDVNDNMLAAAVAQRDQNHLEYTSGSHCSGNGNHDRTGTGIRGDEGNDCALLKQSDLAFHVCDMNPDVEDEGFPNDTDEFSDIPPLDSYDAGDDVTFDAAWRAQYVIPAAEPTQITTQPTPYSRENYFRVRCGPLDVFILDVLRYSSVGDPSATRFSAGQLGDRARNTHEDFGQGMARQLQWLQAEIGASRADGAVWRIAILHIWPGSMGIGVASNGLENYGRLGFLNENEWGRRLRRMLIAGRFSCVILNHDHRAYEFIDDDGLVFLGTPQTGTPSHHGPTSQGWNPFTNLSDLLGTAETGPLGYPNILKTDGSPADPRLKWSWNGTGFYRIVASPTELRVYLRRTAYSRAPYVSAVTDLLGVNQAVEHHVGEVVTPAGEVAALTLPPTTVPYAAIKSEWDAAVPDGWTTPPTNRKGTDPGWSYLALRQPHAAATRTLSGTGDAETLVLAVPADVPINPSGAGAERYYAEPQAAPLPARTDDDLLLLAE